MEVLIYILIGITAGVALLIVYTIVEELTSKKKKMDELVTKEDLEEAKNEIINLINKINNNEEEKEEVENKDELEEETSSIENDDSKTLETEEPKTEKNIDDADFDELIEMISKKDEKSE